MKKKVYSKLLVLTSLGLVGASVPISVALSKGNEVVMTKAVDEEQTPYATYKGIASAWNPYPESDAYLLQFNETLGDAIDKTNLVSTLGSYFKLDGVELQNITGSKIHYSNGSTYFSINIPQANITEGSTLKITGGFKFQNYLIPTMEFVFDANKGLVFKSVDYPADKVKTIEISGVTWNNIDYGGWASGANGAIALFTVSGGNLSNVSNTLIDKSASFFDKVTANGVKLADIDGALVGSFANMPYIYIPYNSFDDIETRTGLKYLEIVIPEDTTLFESKIAPTTLYYVGNFVNNDGGWSIGKRPITYDAINNNYINFWPGVYDGDPNVLMLRFTSNLASKNSNYIDGNHKDNLASKEIGNHIKLNGVPFSSIEGSLISYFSTNLLALYAPGFAKQGSVVTIDKDTQFMDATLPELKFIAFNNELVNGTFTEAAKVTFDSQGGTSVADQYVAINMAATEPVVPTKTGYRFNGWKLDGNPYTFVGVPVTKDIVLVADWVEQKTVTFIANGVETQVSIDVGTKVSPIDDPIKENSHFSGWYADGEYATLFDFENTLINADTSIYAKFTDCSDGEIVYSEPTADHKITATLYCSVDKDEVLATETATGSYSQDSAATCEDGETGHYTYTFTNTKFATQTENVTLNNALGHDYGDPVVTWEGKTATATMTCSHDGSHQITETKDGTFVQDSEATCTSKNLGHYEVTFDNTALGTARTEANSVEGDTPATGHEWSVEVTWDGKLAKASATCEHGCGETLYEEKEANYVKDTNATCHSYETGHFEVTFDNTELGTAQTEKDSYTNTEAGKPDHVFGETVYDWQPIDGGFECTATKECTNDGCEEFVTEEGVVTYEVTTDPTCTQKGVGTYTATFATLGTDTKTIDIDPIGHDAEFIDGEPATCKEDGYKEAYYCNNCKAYYEDENCEDLIGDFEALEIWRLGDGKLAKEDVPHTPATAVIENVVNPTCTEAGSHDEVVYCSVCQKELSRNTVTDPALGHDMSPVAGKDATCKEDGYKAAYFCETCEKYFEDVAGNILIGDADAYASWKLAAGKLAKEDVAHTPAAAVKEHVVNPTCTEAGSHDEVVYCSICGKELSRTPVVDPALGHEWGEGEVTKPATCTENGVKTFTCECGETKTEVIPATGHKLGELIPEVAATTEKEGMKAHYVCSECGQLFDANKMACTAESLVIPKLEPQPEPKKGCGGSVIAASAVVTGLAIAGAALIAAKKKQD